MRSRNHKVRRVWFARGRGAFFGKLQPKNLVIARVGLALAGSLMLATLPALADQPGMESRRDAWLQFMNANPGAERKELRQLFNVQWKTERNDAPRSIAQPVFQGFTVTQQNQSGGAGSAAAEVSNQTRESLRALRFEQKEAQNLLKQNLHEQRNAQNTLQQVAPQKFVNINGRISLDLNSAIENITLGDKLFQAEGSISITVGGETKTVSAGSKVTAAEYVAAKQVLVAGGQKLEIDSSGRAVGGEVDLSALTSGNQTLRVKDLSIPVAVTAAGDFGKGGDVRISGDLTNSGSINAFSSRSDISSALIKADSITNNLGGSINSTLENLTLEADKEFSNFGNISATGSLNITGAKSVLNSGSITAQKDLTLLSPEINNSGRLVSHDGSINLDTPVAQRMLVNNTNGVIQALNDSINLRRENYEGTFDTQLTGGDLLSKNLNLNSGQGNTDVNVKALTGSVNSKGLAVHVKADTETLQIGNQCLEGDPTFYNTGNIDITGSSIVVGEDLAIIAQGNITTSLTSLEIKAQTVNQGFDVAIIAGANITGGAGELSPSGSGNLPNGSTPGATGAVTIDGASASGGNIDFSSASFFQILTNSGGGNFDGGDITLAAFANGSGVNGRILLTSSANLHASGNGSGNNGNVTIVAGGAPGTATNTIILGNITNNGSTGTAPGTGNVTIATVQPNTNDALPITFGTNGSITSGNLLGYFGGGSVSSNAGVSLTGFITSNTTTSRVSIVAGSVSLPGVSANQLSVYAAQDVTTSNAISAHGGVMIVAGRNITSGTGGLGQIVTQATGLSAGSVSIIAGANAQDTASGIYINGASSTGGRIDFTQGSGFGGINAKATSLGQSGGTVNLIAYAGSDNTGNILLSSASSIDSSGIASSGDVNVVAGKTSGSGIVVGLIDSGAGGAIGGDVNLIAASPNSGITLTKGAGFASASSSFVPGAGQLAATISSNRINAFSGDVVVRTNSNASLGDIDISGSAGSVGTITIRTNGSSTFNINGAGPNRSGRLVGSSSGDGGVISVTNIGSTGINIGNLGILFGSSGGDGSKLYLDADNGILTVANGGTLFADSTGAGKTAGTISLRGASITGPNPIILNARAFGGGPGGTIIVETTATGSAGNLTVGTGNGQIQMSVIGAGGTIDLRSGGTLTVATSGVTADNVSLRSNLTTGAGLVLNNTVSGASSVTLHSGGSSTISGTGTVSGGLLTVTGGTGQTTLNTNVATLSVNRGGSVNITEANGVSISGVTSGNFRLGAGGLVTVAGAINASSTTILTTGQITLLDDINSAGGGGIVLVSGADVFANPLALDTDLRTSVAGGAAGDLVVVAGATFTDNGNDFTITGPSATGGNVNISGLHSIKVTDSALGSSGGDVTLIAYQIGTKGFVGLLATDLITSGNGGASGNVSVVGGSGLLLGSINTAGGTSGGSIDLLCAQPNAPVTISKDSGAYASGSFFGGVAGTGFINTNGLSTSGASINVSTNGTIDLNGINTNSNTNNGNGGDVSIRSLVQSGSVDIGAISANGLGAGHGGSVVIDSAALTVGDINANGGATGAGGNIDVDSGNLSIGALSANGGANAAGGTINVTAVRDGSALVFSSVSAIGNNFEAGEIHLRNGGNGGITVTTSSLNVGTSGANGVTSGGTIDIDAGFGAVDGLLTVLGTSPTMDVTGSLTNGSLSLKGSAINFNVSGTGIKLDAGALGTLGGVITLSATTGGIDTNDNAFEANAGNAINISSVGEFSTQGSGSSQAIRLTSGAGGLNAAGVNFNASSVNGGALIRLETVGALSVGDLRSDGSSTNAGGLILVSRYSPDSIGSISVGNISSVGFNLGTKVEVDARSSTSLVIGSINASGNRGGVILVTQLGSGGITLNGDVNASGLTQDAGTFIRIASGSGGLQINGPAVISAEGASGRSNGDIQLVGAFINVAGGTLTVDANGAGSTTSSGDVSITNLTTFGNDFFVSGRTVGIGFIDTSGGSTGGGDVSIAAMGDVVTGNINTTSSNSGFAGGSVSIQSANSFLGNLAVGTINTSGNGIGNGGDVAVQVGANGGTLTMGQITADGGASGSGGAVLVSLNQATSHTLSSISSQGIVDGQITITKQGAGVLTTNTITGGTVSITAADQITLNGSVSGSSEINLLAGGGSNIVQTGGTLITPSLKLQITAGSIGSISSALQISNNGNAMSLDLHAGNGASFVSYLGSDTLTLAGGSNGQTLTIGTVSGRIATGGDVTFNGDINITTNDFTNAHTMTSNGGSISIQSNVGSDLVIDGGTGGSLSANGLIHILSNSDELTLEGITTYQTEAYLETGSGTGVIHIAANSNSIASVTSTLDTGSLDFQGSGPSAGLLTTFDPPFGQAGNTWVFLNIPGGTYANTTTAGLGDVSLTGNLNFGGLNLAIIAGHDINLSGATINLSGPTQAGSLTMLAGYTFTPDTGGLQVNNDAPTKFTNFTANAGGGNITGGANINVASASGAGARVIAIANGGEDSAGVITLGNINASGGTTGGNVMIIAEGGISVGSINTSGSTSASAGNVTLAVANASLYETFSVQNGTASYGGIILGPSTPPLVSVGASTAGDLSFGGINAGGAIVNITGALSAGTDSIVGSGTVIAGILNVNSGAGIADIGSTAIATLNSAATGSSSVSLNNNGNLTLGTITGANQSLEVSTTGQMEHSLSAINVATLKLTADTFNLSGSTIGTAGVSDITIESTNTLSGSFLGTIGGGQVRLVQAASMTDVSILTGINVISATNLTLRTTGAGSNIGTSPSNRFILPANQTAITAISDHGSVFLTTALPATDTLTVLGAAGGTNGHFDVLGTGNIHVGSISTTDGDINISTAVNRITVAPSAILSANGLNTGNGDISLSVLDQSKNSKKTSVITIQTGAQLRTLSPKLGDGVISLSVGAPSAPILGKAPKKNVIVNPSTGTIFWGKKTAGFSASVTNFTATGTNIIFNNPIGNKAILVSGATFNADPPVAEGTPTWSYSSPEIATAAAPTSSLPVMTAAANAVLQVEENAISETHPTLLGFDTADSMASLAIANAATMNLSGSPIAKGMHGSPFENPVRADEDNSYIVGYMGDSIGETDAAICSDAEVGLSDSVADGQRGCRQIQHSSRVSIGHENVLFIPSNDTIVETPNGNIKICAKAIVLVSSTDAGLAVYDLDDQHKGSVSVESNGHNVVLSPGRHVMVTKHHTAEFAQINAVETIAHRNVQSTVKNGHRAHTSEFSVLTAMDTVKPLKALAMSKHANAKHIADRMLKTTAIILQIGGASGQYQHYFKPRMTAMQK